MKIKMISVEEAQNIIDSRTPKGLFFLYEQSRDGRDIVTGIDNLTGDAWTENFATLIECLDWLSADWENEVLEGDLDVECRRTLHMRIAKKAAKQRTVSAAMILPSHPNKVEIELLSLSGGRYTQFRIDSKTVMLLDSSDLEELKKLIETYQGKLADTR